MNFLNFPVPSGQLYDSPLAKKPPSHIGSYSLIETTMINLF